jgi:hypothetical protein
LTDPYANDNLALAAVAEQYRDTSQPSRIRSRRDFTALFGGYELIAPGGVYLEDWRSDDVDAGRVPPAGAGGLALKP